MTTFTANVFTLVQPTYIRLLGHGEVLGQCHLEVSRICAWLLNDISKQSSYLFLGAVISVSDILTMPDGFVAIVLVDNDVVLGQLAQVFSQVLFGFSQVAKGMINADKCDLMIGLNKTNQYQFTNHQ